MLAEAGVGISPLLDRLPVLLPEKQEGDTLVALKLPMDLVPVRFDPGRGCRSFLLLQNLCQKSLGTRFRQGPGNEFELPKVLGNGGRGQGQALGNGSSRHFHLAGESENLSGMVHRQPRVWHRIPPDLGDSKHRQSGGYGVHARETTRAEPEGVFAMSENA